MRRLKRILASILVVTLVMTGIQLPALETHATGSTENLTNIAPKATASIAAGNASGGNIANVNNGNYNDDWQSNAFPATAKLDLHGTYKNISKIVVKVGGDTNSNRTVTVKAEYAGSSDSATRHEFATKTGATVATSHTLEVATPVVAECIYVTLSDRAETDNNNPGFWASIAEIEIYTDTPEEVFYEYVQFNPTTTVNGVEKYVLEKNATANSEQYPVGYGNDGTAQWAFDGNDSHWWHSRYQDWDQIGQHDTNDVVTSAIKSDMFNNGNTLWIGSGFDESILLSKITYQGRGNGQGLIGGYNLYVANLGEPSNAPTVDDFRLIKSGTLGNTNNEQEILLDVPVYATHFKLEATSYATGAGGDSRCIAAKTIKVFKAQELSVESLNLPKAGSINASDANTTTEQPFAAGTGGSQNFRIPALITLKNGNLLAAADARWTGSGDWGGLDTIASVSADNGQTWKYSFPVYFPDSAQFTARGLSTTAIDPILVQGNDGTIYCVIDMNPSGITTQDTMPGIGTGYVTVDGVRRLALTSNYANASTLPTDGDTTTYEYYVGDFDENGYAKVLSRTDNTESGYAVDKWYNLYSVVGEQYVANLAQRQVDSDTMIQQNAFYKDSRLHVYNTGYIWVVTSTDGLTWNDPYIISDQIKRVNTNDVSQSTEKGLLISPGKGLVTSDGTIVIPVYDTGDGQENASFIYSADGIEWKRTGDVQDRWSSESEMVELNNGVLRMFYRNGTGYICYADAQKNSSGVYEFISSVQTSIPVCSTCNVTALKHSEAIDGKSVVLVACPGGSGRANGKIYSFLINDDNSMELFNTYSFNEGTFQYSCMTELNNRDIGILWENAGAAIRYDSVVKDYALGTTRAVELGVGDLYKETHSGDATMIIAQEPAATVAKMFIKENMEYLIPVYDHTQNIDSNLNSFATTENSAISLSDAEFTFTKNGDFWHIKNEEKNQYLIITDAPNYFGGTAQNIRVQTINGGGDIVFRLDRGNRYAVFFDTNMVFDAYHTADVSNVNDNKVHFDLVLFEKQDKVSESDIIPGYKRASGIKDGGTYLIGYIWSDGTIIMLYPVNGQANQTKKLGSSDDQRAVRTKELMFKGVGEGNTTAIVDGLTYNIKVATSSDDTSRDIPVEVLNATAGNNERDNGPDNAIDGNTSTIWHSNYDNDENKSRENLWIQFEITQGNYTVDGLRYLPRGTRLNGVITRYQIWVSNDSGFSANDSTTRMIAEGSWDDDGKWKLASFAESVNTENVRYVRLKAVESFVNGSYSTGIGFASAAEIRLTGIDNKARLRVAVAEAEKALALNLDSETVSQKVSAANTVLATESPTFEAITNAYNELVQAMNAAVVIEKDGDATGYTVTVVDGTITNGNNFADEGNTENTKYNVPYNTKVMITAAETDAEGRTFVGWKVLGDIISTERDYTFYVPNNITITAVYEAQKVEPTATISNIVVSDMEDPAKVKVQFVGQLSYSQSDYELVAAGLKWLGSALKNEGVDVTTGGKEIVVPEVNKSLQFSVTLTGVPKGEGKFVRGVVFVTLRDKVTGEELTFYSAERKVLSGTIVDGGGQ